MQWVKTFYWSETQWLEIVSRLIFLSEGNSLMCLFPTTNIKSPDDRRGKRSRNRSVPPTFRFGRAADIRFTEASANQAGSMCSSTSCTLARPLNSLTARR